jgi:hypothetical protein
MSRNRIDGTGMEVYKSVPNHDHGMQGCRRLLRAWGSGGAEERDAMMTLVSRKKRRCAAACLPRQGAEHLLQPTLPANASGRLTGFRRITSGRSGP